MSFSTECNGGKFLIRDNQILTLNDLYSHWCWRKGTLIKLYVCCIIVLSGCYW